MEHILNKFLYSNVCMLVNGFSILEVDLPIQILFSLYMLSEKIDLLSHVL